MKGLGGREQKGTRTNTTNIRTNKTLAISRHSQVPGTTPATPGGATIVVKKNEGIDEEAETLLPETKECGETAAPNVA